MFFTELNKEFRTNGVSLRVEPGISFFFRKYLVDEAIKFPFKKVLKQKIELEIKTLTLLEISLRKERCF